MAKKSKITIANNKLSRVGIEWLLNFLIQISLISNQNHTLHCTIIQVENYGKRKDFSFLAQKLFSMI